MYKSFVSLGRYIPKYFILFVAMVNCIISLISLSVFSLLVYKNARDFCVLILYPATLLYKSRDITFSTKVCLVKAMVFPVVMYGFESWTVKKAERQKIDAFEVWCW